MSKKKFSRTKALWDSIKKFFRYPNKSIWFTLTERLRRLWHKKIKGRDSFMINSYTGRAIYETDHDLKKSIDNCGPFEFKYRQYNHGKVHSNDELAEELTKAIKAKK